MEVEALVEYKEIVKELWKVNILLSYVFFSEDEKTTYDPLEDVVVVRYEGYLKNGLKHGKFINYNDSDGNGNSLGLNTSWTTGSASSGTFTVQLQHQPDVKTATSGSNDGDTDFALTFNLNIN